MGDVYTVRLMGKRDEKMIVIPGTHGGEYFKYSCDTNGVRTYTPMVTITSIKKEEPKPKPKVESYYEEEETK